MFEEGKGGLNMPRYSISGQGTSACHWCGRLPPKKKNWFSCKFLNLFPGWINVQIFEEKEFIEYWKKCIERLCSMLIFQSKTTLITPRLKFSQFSDGVCGVPKVTENCKLLFPAASFSVHIYNFGGGGRKYGVIKGFAVGQI